MSHEIDIHKAQTAILRELLFHSHAGYAQMQKPTGLSSDHFNFHIKRLITLGFVGKEARGKYKLTVKGKEYANRLDTDENTVERQPKVAVILRLERDRPDRKEYLFQQRRKNPYFGFWGLPTGKIRWGETVIEAADRELLEETNLVADFLVTGVYHEHVVLDDSKDKITEDKMFFVCRGKNVKGRLLKDFEGGHNEWLTREGALSKDDVFPNFDLELDFVGSTKWLQEHKLTYEAQKF